MIKETLNYCTVDYKNKHCWKLVGNVSFEYLIYKCTQCMRCKLVRIRYIEDIHVEDEGGA